MILRLVAEAPGTGYDVERISDASTRYFWGASYGWIYPALRRLEAENLVRRRRAWFEHSAAMFRGIGEDLDVEDDEVLRYGVELTEWNAAGFAGLESRLSQD